MPERTPTAKTPTAILISGAGSNMAALIDAAKAADYPAEIRLVISNRPKAVGIEIARANNIETLIIDHKAYPSREAFDEALHQALIKANIELICSAGFTRLLTENFVARWHNRQLNIHPSLLPAFKGLATHQRVLDAGARITGCTVHFIRHEMDCGPIVAQAAVPVLADDTAESLRHRVHAAEHKIYPEALRLVASGTIRVDGERIIQAPETTGKTTKTAALFSPAIA